MEPMKKLEETNEENRPNNQQNRPGNELEPEDKKKRTRLIDATNENVTLRNGFDYIPVWQ